MILLVLSGLALSGEPAGDPRPQGGTTSVAWVSPVSRRVMAHKWLPLVATRDLRALAQEGDTDIARLLQALGLRKSHRPPRRAWKVTIFEVPIDSLCRPLAVGEPGEVADGLFVCKRGDKGIPGAYEGLGRTTDLRTQQEGLEIFSLQWRDAAASGFCVLPAERFLVGR